ncbi:hypothetical protein Tco_0550950 [Tanacetum coccineum]
MEAVLRDMMSNQFRDAEEYAYHLEQSKNYMENQIVWESRQEDIRRSKPYAHVFYGPQRNLNEPPRYLYNKDLFFLMYGNSKVRKYVLLLHKIHIFPFPKEDLEENMNRWVRKEFKTSMKKNDCQSNIVKIHGTRQCTRSITEELELIQKNISQITGLLKLSE